jgi:signal transduction histidine kinase
MVLREKVVPTDSADREVADNDRDLLDMLQGVRDELKDRLETRNAELQLANERLESEIRKRRRSEEALKEHANRLKSANRIIREVNEDLQEANARLETSNRELDQFTYVASHDLRAPLRAIEELSQWIEEDLDGQLGDETRKNMELLRARVGRMKRMINDVLEYSRAGKDGMEPEDVEVGGMVKEIVDLIEAPPGFIFHRSAELPLFHTVRGPLYQVLFNLINNAFKHHHRENGKIEVLSADDGDCFRFSVIDDGPGIPDELHEKVFGMFHSFNPKAKEKSSGIGLAIVKKIVEKAGGRIELRSTAGEGSTFEFTWPKWWVF